MLGNKFMFSTISWTTVPYDLTNSTSNLQNPYQLGAGSTIETFFILPPNDKTIYDYQQNGVPVLLSGFWNSNGQFVNNQTILGSYGNPYGCLIYGGITECIGFGQFVLTNPLTYLQNEPYINNTAYAVSAAHLHTNESDNGYMYGLFYINTNSSGDSSLFYYTNYTNSTYIGYFYPYYTFYNASISLNKYFNSYDGAVMQINADYGYYIPVYQATGVCPLFATNCNNYNPGSILNMIDDAKTNSYSYQYVEDNLIFAISTSAIQINIPSPIYYFSQVQGSQTRGNGQYEYVYYYKRYNATNDGITNILINQQGSVTYSPYGKTSIYLIPSVPSSGSQTNVFAFYDKMINN